MGARAVAHFGAEDWAGYQDQVADTPERASAANLARTSMPDLYIIVTADLHSDRGAHFGWYSLLRNPTS